MADFTQLTLAARAYVVVVVLSGIGILAHSVQSLHSDPIGPQWLVLAALTLLTGCFTVKVPSTDATISVSEAFVFASVLLFGASVGAVTVSLECLIILYRMNSERRSIHRILFNVAAPAVAIWTSATVFFLTSGIKPYSTHGTPVESLIVPLLLFTLLYFLLNSWLVAIALGLETRQSSGRIWWTHFTPVSISYFSGASLAAVIVTYSHQLDLSTLSLIVPMLLVSYLTFRTSLARVDDANRHLTELNALYFSTIETLAMAIDAKDQITHGHIRRVQAYAVRLARQLGVHDDSLIRAIEAAALLHDLGTLAVPEYILNKPGRLTATEFERIKLHASVGANILSSISFPYPVVPIVRHHHENWDGTGYPDRLKATEIPIGARILSVVDCFDALTSDRPCRPRLSDAEAVGVLVQRRGSMYDPLVVDTFVSVYNQIRIDSSVSKDASHGSSGALSAPISLSPRGFDDIAASVDDNVMIYELAEALSDCENISTTIDTVVRHIRRLIPFSWSVFYRHDANAGLIEAAQTFGEPTGMLNGFTIPMGQRLSGWVAANHQTIVNSDPVLDLGDVARTATPRLRSCLSTPLMAGTELVGVLSLYSPVVDGFSEDHRRIIERVLRHAAQAFRRAGTKVLATDSTALACQGEAGAVDPGDLPSGPSRPWSDGILILIVVDGLARFKRLYGEETAEAVLREVASRSHSIIRGSVFRYRCDELALIVSHDDLKVAESVGLRLREAIESAPISLPIDIAHSLKVRLVVGSARSGAGRTITAGLCVTAPNQSLSTVH